MKIVKLIENVLQKYWEHGYDVSEVLLPNEFYDELHKELKAKTKLDFGGLHTDSGLVKIFQTQARHMQFIVRSK